MNKRSKMYMASVKVGANEFNEHVFGNICIMPYDIENIWLIPSTYETGVYEKQ